MRAKSRRHLGMLLLAAGFVPSAALHAQDGAPPAAAPAPAPSATPPASAPLVAAAGRDRREAARQDAEKRLRASVLPTPMTAERFAAFLRAVDPALATNADLAAAFTTYADEARAALETSATKITDRLPAAYTFDAAREEFVMRPNPELMQVLALRDRAATRVLAAERALLRLVALATPDERKIRFVEERLGWLDERTPRDGLLPSTRLTLLEVVGRAKLPPESLASIEPVLVAHADKLAALRETRIATLRDADTRRARIETDAGTLWRLGPADRVRATEALLTAVDDGEFASELAIRDLHFDTLGRLRGRLPNREGRRVVEEWQRSVHPELFDDERLLSKLIEESIALPTSEPETDAAILDAVENAYRKLEPLARDASNAADLVLPRLLDRSDASVLAEIDARQSVLAIQSKRRSAIRDLVARVRIFVGATDEAVTAQFNGMNETLAALERADQFDQASLGALRIAIESQPEDAETERGEQPGQPARPAGSSPAETAPADRPRQSDTRATNRPQDENTGGNRSGRGSRRQQGPAGNG